MLNKLKSAIDARIEGTDDKKITAELKAYRYLVEYYAKKAEEGDVESVCGLLRVTVLDRVEWMREHHLLNQKAKAESVWMLSQLKAITNPC